MRCRFLLVGALFAAAASAQDAEYTVAPVFEFDRPIDRVLERVDAAKDVWIGEQDYEAINAELKKRAGRIKTGEGGFEPLADELKLFKKLELVEFKMIGSSRADSESDVAAIDVRVELGGEAVSGGLLSLLGPMKMRWRRDDGAWQPVAAEVGELREVRADRPYFQEITDQVFGGIPSFEKQLSRGLDDWRGSLDAALGVTVYGHQGVSLGDVDGDGLDDLYISQPGGLPNLLYRNQGDGTFADITAESGVDVLDDTSMALFADLDNDGDQDLVLIGAQPMLFRNDGRGRFSYDARSGLRPSPDRAGLYTGAALADYDLDGDLDLYVCSYDFWQAGAEYDAPTPYYDATNGPPNLLFRNRGDGSFEDVTDAAGLMENNDRFSFAAAWGDYDDDGDPDLYVANDFGRNNLYRNNGDGTFSDVAPAAGVEDLGAGMSAAWGDYDNDGDLDLYVSNMWSSAGQRLTFNPQFEQVASSEEIRKSFQRQARGNSLFRNGGDGAFTEISEEAGVTMGRWAWSSDFVDFDSDGWLDIFVQNGYITGERLDDL